ncbi:MAG: glycosyltransferase, partial [Waterburya sp.]
GIQDLLTDNCGLLVEVGDTDALARAMAEIIDNPQQTAQMGQNGYQKIKNYSVDQIIQLYVNIYNQALVNHE